MSSRTSDIRALVIVPILIFVGAFFLLLLSPTPGKSTLSSRSDERNGAMALRLWLERSGYDVNDSLAIPADLIRADLLFVLQPASTYTLEIAEAVRAWVTQGNTLIVAGSPSSVGTLLSAFDVRMEWLYNSSPDHLPGIPTLNNPPVSAEIQRYAFGISSSRPDFVPHIFDGETPILASFHEGRGIVWVSGLLYPFTNEGIQEEQNAHLILNLLTHISADAHIAFDEGLYVFGSGTQTLEDWLFRTAPGIGILLLIAITFGFLFIQGRAFGRPLPLVEEKLRREPVEYIRAIARLFRRAGGREDVLHHYRAQFRRRLAIRYGVDPALPDAQFIQNLIYRDPSLDEESLRDLLYRLSRTQVSEAALVETAHDVDIWLRKLT